MTLFLFLNQHVPGVRDVSFDRLAVIGYILTGLVEISSALVLGVGGPALGGFFAMLPWGLLTWLKMGEAGSWVNG